MKSWDIFCRVIDNFGDIGVCWRLARQLAGEHGHQVRLWVNDLDALIRIWPDARPIEHQQLEGVEVRQWSAEFLPSVPLADCVIEAFACEIPSVYLVEMVKKKQAGCPPVWINLEYLSAESWVDDCHQMHSIHPTTGLRKTFFFPGFTPRTGGLLRESALIKMRDELDPAEWLATIPIKPLPDALLISLFAYENPAVADLLTIWENSSKPVHCLVPEGKILTSINQLLGQQLKNGDIHCKGNVCLQVIPFLTQTEYDKLLWACDINFVRGEDSFVRAQWAAKPLLWHIYPQDEDAHIIKLKAFLDVYTASAPSQLQQALQLSWLAWNCNQDMGNSWQHLLESLGQWQQHSRNWCDLLLKQPDLASQLVAYCTNQQD